MQYKNQLLMIMLQGDTSHLIILPEPLILNIKYFFHPY